jgi:hypothetical protein
MNKAHRKLNQVFICYRREGSSWVAGRIYDSLARKFGRNVVFKDIDSIPLGINFREHIESAVRQCSVFLVIVYDKWMGENLEIGTRRIEDKNDFVRVEIEVALQRHIPVIPLLIENTVMPSAENLPESLKELASRNGMRVNNDPYFHMDMDRLINRLEPSLQFQKGDTKTLKRLTKWALVFLVTLLSIIAIAYITKLIFKWE